ncbi:MAG: SIR2 family protein [Proteobacteria bacterium]|nr:SIR2 family protein [Pseudomonadota bacterium]
MEMDDLLKRGMNGGNMLFCGAGFSADCLNFSKNDFGVANGLLEELNDELDLEHPFGELQHAADAYLEKCKYTSLLKLLRDKYQVLQIPTVVNDILKYPWDKIYTTNYDDVISQSLKTHGIKCCVVNNTDEPLEIKDIHDKKTKRVVHLHGAIERWNNLRNFESSCVLGYKSYMEIGVSSKWLSTFRDDYTNATGIFFIGFSNNDFHIAQKIRSITASQGKVFFINSENSERNPDLISRQKNYGTVHSIGKKNFADIVNSVLESDEPPPPSFSNFEYCEPVKPSKKRASVKEQWDFFISGKQNNSLLYRDIIAETHSYRAKRESTEEVIEFLKDGNSIALVRGGICSGKTTILGECVIKFLMDGNHVFRFKTPYPNLLEEVKTIINKYPDSVIVIDNCFSDLRESIGDIVKMFNESGHRLLLASRTFAHDSEEDLKNIISKATPFKIFDTEILNQQEAKDIINCADRLAVWDKKVKSFGQKKYILERTNHSRLASFLLHVFKSKNVRDIFILEINKMKAKSGDVEKALIIALYLRNIKGYVKEIVLSELIQKDSLALFKKFIPTSPFISYNYSNKEFDVISGVNAKEALNVFFNKENVTNAIIDAVTALEDVRHEDTFKDALSQMIRYTNLKHVVKDKEQQNYFFDELSLLWFCRNHVHFWLQWSIAMRDHEDWEKAKQYLYQAYRLCKPHYITFELDDQKARLLLLSIPETCPSNEAVQIFRDASSLLTESIRRGGGDTPHNYRTMQSFDVFFKKTEHILSQGHKEMLVSNLNHLKKIVESKLKNQSKAKTQKAMEEAIVSIDKALGMLQPTKLTTNN